MKRAFLVVGPEGSGTRLATRILINGGCIGSAEHFQPFDKGSIEGENVVWRRSFPHLGQWPRVEELLSRLWDYGYKSDVSAVLTIRDPFVLERSQVANKHASTLLKATENVRMGFLQVWNEVILTGVAVQFVPLVYESLLLNPRKVQRALLERLGLDTSRPPLVIHHGNQKYWEAK